MLQQSSLIFSLRVFTKYLTACSMIKIISQPPYENQPHSVIPVQLLVMILFLPVLSSLSVPPAPDISFLSNYSTSSSSPAKSSAHEQIQTCDIIRSSTPERGHILQEERSSQEISMLSHDEALGHSQDQN